MLGADTEALEEDISCTDKKLADIPHDADITIKGVSVTKQRCQGLKSDKHYGLHSSEFSAKTAVVDQDMLVYVDISPSHSPCRLYHPTVGRSREDRQAPGRDTFHHGVYGRRHETPSRRSAHLPGGSQEGCRRGYHPITPGPTSGIRADG